MEQVGPLLRPWGIRLDADQTSQLEVFLNELDVWNRKLNLTGASSRQRILTELVTDSLLPTPFLPNTGTLLDVGSGGGFPAIPIKICNPGLRCHLIEPQGKKVHFLRQVIRCAGLQDIEVIQCRIEQAEQHLLSEGYDVVTSRAFVPLSRYLTLCAPHLSSGGLMVAFLGAGSEKTIMENQELIGRHCLFILNRRHYTLPGQRVNREILILKRNA
jgi:16S rRNA (guanine527-N7)-methyltransferase